jgi:hypothetical protein
VDEKRDTVIQAPSLYSIAGGEEEENHCMWAYSLGEMAKTMTEVSFGPETVLSVTLFSANS